MSATQSTRDPENTLYLDLKDGRVVIELRPDIAPLHVEQIKTLVRRGFYDGTVFHRVIEGFMAQGGDPTGTGTGGPGYQFKDELPKSSKVYTDGAVAMANSGPNTNGSQFFIVASNQAARQLSPSYSYFGRVTSGLAVVQKINSYGTASAGGTPSKVIKITKVTISAS
jgi:peptidylprolyl isomerase